MGTQESRNQVPEPSERIGSLCMFRQYEPERINYVRSVGWEEIELAVDSGASETVIGTNMAESADLVEGKEFRAKIEYEMADGQRVPNLGEKSFVVVDDDGLRRSMKAQVCDISKGLLSVSRVVNAGNTVVFSPKENYIQDGVTGERMWITERRGMYLLKLWTKGKAGGKEDF